MQNHPKQIYSEIRLWGTSYQVANHRAVYTPGEVGFIASGLLHLQPMSGVPRNILDTHVGIMVSL